MSINNRSMNLGVCGTWRQRLCCGRFVQCQEHLHFIVNNILQGKLDVQIFFSRTLNTILIMLWRFPSHFLLEVDIRSRRLFLLSDQLSIESSYRHVIPSCFTSQAVCLVLISHSASAVVPSFYRRTVTRYFRIAFLCTWLWESHLMNLEKKYSPHNPHLSFTTR